MSTTHGNDGEVFVGANQVSETRSWTLNKTAETADDTAQGDTDRTHKAGHKTADGSIQCMMDKADTNGQEAMAVGNSVTLNLYPGGNTSGQIQQSMTATITGENESVDMGEIEMREFSFLVNGAITETTVV